MFSRSVKMNGKRQFIGIVAAVLLIVALAAIYRQVCEPGGARLPAQIWFYDLNTGKLFPASIDSVPPIAAPSGPLPTGEPAGVLAHVVTCTTCDESERIIVYLGTRSPEAQARLAELRKIPAGTEVPAELRSAAEEGVLVRSLGDSTWTDQRTLAGRSIEDDPPRGNCQGRNLRRCYPVNP